MLLSSFRHKKLTTFSREFKRTAAWLKWENSSPAVGNRKGLCHNKPDVCQDTYLNRAKRTEKRVPKVRREVLPTTASNHCSSGARGTQPNLVSVHRSSAYLVRHPGSARFSTFAALSLWIKFLFLYMYRYIQTILFVLRFEFSTKNYRSVRWSENFWITHWITTRPDGTWWKSMEKYAFHSVIKGDWII